MVRESPSGLKHIIIIRRRTRENEPRARPSSPTSIPFSARGQRFGHGHESSHRPQMRLESREGRDGERTDQGPCGPRLMTRQQRSLKSIERLEQMQVRRINDIWEEVQAAVAEARGEILVVCAQIRR